MHLILSLSPIDFRQTDGLFPTVIISKLNCHSFVCCKICISILKDKASFHRSNEMQNTTRGHEQEREHNVLGAILQAGMMDS